MCVMQSKRLVLSMVTAPVVVFVPGSLAEDSDSNSVNGPACWASVVVGSCECKDVSVFELLK